MTECPRSYEGIFHNNEMEKRDESGVNLRNRAGYKNPSTVSKLLILKARNYK
jgi:hypothetical protein